MSLLVDNIIKTFDKFHIQVSEQTVYVYNDTYFSFTTQNVWSAGLYFILITTEQDDVADKFHVRY